MGIEDVRGVGAWREYKVGREREEVLESEGKRSHGRSKKVRGIVVKEPNLLEDSLHTALSPSLCQPWILDFNLLTPHAKSTQHTPIYRETNKTSTKYTYADTSSSSQ
ncbi:hypothetical protein VNO78_14912 [Psophocarpus tetragonolobus]|uniref:Uncharacterized protein n=1 Tax=Psophocarpus tetragonolobus TaxID=3891 RepID=A0AAN9SE33_PSOTE